MKYHLITSMQDAVLTKDVQWVSYVYSSYTGYWPSILPV